jgi:hypothetical protein
VWWLGLGLWALFSSVAAPWLVIDAFLSVRRTIIIDSIELGLLSVWWDTA